MLTEFVGFEMNFERDVFLSTDENKLDRKKTANAIHCRIYVSDKIYQQLRGLVVIN